MTKNANTSNSGVDQTPEVGVKPTKKRKPARDKRADLTMRYNFRIYPNVDQQEALNRFMSHARVVYNDYVYHRRKNNNRATLKDGVSVASLVTAGAKKTEERAWLAETPSTPLQQSVRDAETAFSNYYSSKSGERKGNAMGKPRFKKKDKSGGRVRFVGSRFAVRQTNKRRALLKLTGISKEITVHLSRDIPEHVSSATIIKKPNGTWWVSFVVDVNKKPAPKTGRMVGIDVGSHDLATLVTSDGERWKTGNPRVYNALREKLALADQSLARSVKGSARYEKKRIARAKIYAKMVRMRQDWQRTLAAQIADEFDVIVVEKLSAKQLIEKLALSTKVSVSVIRTEHSMTTHGVTC